MMTISQVSRQTKLSVRTLQYYDRIGLLAPAAYTESGYRLYDDASLEVLQQILLFRELGFPLKEIRDILAAPDYDRRQALEQQIALLTMKKEHLENLILFARGIQMLGVRAVDFSVFDTTKMDEYARRAKEQWGKTDEYREFEEKAKGRSETKERALMAECMQLFAEFGRIKEHSPESEDAQALVKKLQDFISDNFYRCSDNILLSLTQMYEGGGEFTANIDGVGGAGTAAFAASAIRAYVRG